MREILFRGKIAKNGKWVEGDYVRLKDRKHSTEHYIYGKGKVIPETVGQFTGLTDKNGNKIFEGDILKVYEKEENTQNVLVFYEAGQFVVSHYALKLLTYRTIRSEVIGNMYDNPELFRRLKYEDINRL